MGARINLCKHRHFISSLWCSATATNAQWNEQLCTFLVDGVFVVIFVVALIFHGHQTEATYRLDFIWKLQATGMLTIVEFCCVCVRACVS